LHIFIQDWGTGFDPAKADRSRHGLEGIRERAKLLGGKATIDSTVGGGTRIVVEIPIHDEVRPCDNQSKGSKHEDSK
jgi:signal transduction histidine kinase